MTYVGIGRRFVAALIDGILLGIVSYLLAIVTGQTTEAGFNLQGAPAFLAFLIGFGYFIVLEATLGATLGKLIMGLRVLKLDGSPIGWGPSVIRNLMRIVDFLPFAYIAGIVAVLVSKKKQRLGDMAAGTAVVRRGEAPVSLSS
jgi:uncharacterized RDD family membrane protein YckC